MSLFTRRTIRRLNARASDVLLTNNYTGSGGDGFAVYFRAAGLGTIVGTRTRGIVVGNVGMPALVEPSPEPDPQLAAAIVAIVRQLSLRP